MFRTGTKKQLDRCDKKMTSFCTTTGNNKTKIWCNANIVIILFIWNSDPLCFCSRLAHLYILGKIVEHHTFFVTFLWKTFHCDARYISYNANFDDAFNWWVAVEHDQMTPDAIVRWSTSRYKIHLKLFQLHLYVSISFVRNKNVANRLISDWPGIRWLMCSLIRRQNSKTIDWTRFKREYWNPNNDITMKHSN